ncbi:50S ribosomal protein L23 [Candidatus Pacearchaeota archaeon]|nr:50S ribosomal protein L23 [Candidatus Pacearchaeota archaeon]
MRLVSTEKAVRLIELNNTIVVEVDRRKNKKEITQEFLENFGGKIDSMNTLIKNNKKIAYIKLNKDTPAIDIATKLGMI